MLPSDSSFGVFLFKICPNCRMDHIFCYGLARKCGIKCYFYNFLEFVLVLLSHWKTCDKLDLAILIHGVLMYVHAKFLICRFIFLRSIIGTYMSHAHMMG